MVTLWWSAGVNLFNFALRFVSGDFFEFGCSSLHLNLGKHDWKEIEMLRYSIVLVLKKGSHFLSAYNLTSSNSIKFKNL
jgi:hypothetical protein